MAEGNGKRRTVSTEVVRVLSCARQLYGTVLAVHIGAAGSTKGRASHTGITTQELANHCDEAVLKGFYVGVVGQALRKTFSQVVAKMTKF